MTEPNPPALFRLNPIIANARYQAILNLEGRATVIFDGPADSTKLFA